MSPKIFRSVSFFAFLRLLDRDLAAMARDARCGHCGGPLHVARYPRELRGLPDEVASWFTKRESFCCGAKACRRRTTPPSVVFFGRRFYHAAMVLLVSALSDGASERRLRRLSRHFDINRRTLLRWQSFWRETFPESEFWRAEGSRFSPPLRRGRILRDLLSRFAGAARDRLLSALLFLSPFTTGSVAREHAGPWALKTRRGGVVIAS